MWNGWCSPIICKFSTCLSIWGFLYLPWSSDVDGHPWIKKGLIYPLYGIPIPNDGGMTIYPIYKVLTMDNLGIKTICFLFKSDHIRAFDLFFWTLNFDPHPHLIDQITTSLRISQCHRNDAWSGVTIPKQPDFRFVIYYNLPIMMIMIPLDHDDSDHSDSDGNHKHHHHHHHININININIINNNNNNYNYLQTVLPEFRGLKLQRLKTSWELASNRRSWLVGNTRGWMKHMWVGFWLLGHQAIYFWALIVANHADRVDQGDWSMAKSSQDPFAWRSASWMELMEILIFPALF